MKSAPVDPLDAAHATLRTALTNPLSPKLPDQIATTLTGHKLALAKLTDTAGDFAINVGLAILILAATLWIASWASALAREAIRRLPRTRNDVTLQSFAASMARYAVLILGATAILHRLGVETTSIITVLGAASLAIGLALQGALSNVAAGVMILVFRPYRVGDFVTIVGKSGTVKRLDLFNTELVDVDGLKVVAPNGKAFGDVIVNYTDIPRRRIELNFAIDHREDVARVIETVLETARKEARLLLEPLPWCMATDMTATQVTVTFRGWTTLEAYWDTRFTLLAAFKGAFEVANIAIPLPSQPLWRADTAPRGPGDAPLSGELPRSG